MDHYSLCLLGLVLVLLGVVNRGNTVEKNVSMASARTYAKTVVGSQFVNMADGNAYARSVARSHFANMADKNLDV